MRETGSLRLLGRWRGYRVLIVDLDRLEAPHDVARADQAMESYRDALQRARDAVQDSSEEVVKLRKEFDAWPQHNELDKGRSLLVGTHRQRSSGHRFSP
jgi:hypothetical protein